MEPADITTPGPGLHIFFGNLAILGDTATVAGVELRLTSFEQAILRRLAQSPSECVTRDELHVAMYGTDPQPPRTANVIEVMVSRLRKKLRAARADVAVLTIRGRGYTLFLGIAEQPTP